MSCAEIKLKIDQTESSFTLRQNWQIDGRKSEYYLTLRDKEDNFGKICALIDRGSITISAHFHLYNHTKFHLIFENRKNHEKYLSLPERPMLLTFNSKGKDYMKDLTVAVKGQVSKLDFFECFQHFKVLELDVSANSKAKFIASRETHENFTKIKICSNWMLKNKTDKEYLFRENSLNDQDIWIKAGPKEIVPFYSSLEEPILVLRDSHEACQTEPFMIASSIEARTLRLTSKVCFLQCRVPFITYFLLFSLVQMSSTAAFMENPMSWRLMKHMKILSPTLLKITALN